MIQSFRNKETEVFYHTGKSRKIDPQIQERALIRLQRLNAATSVDDLRFPHSHNLEKLTGDRKDYWSIRINRQWRVCFSWEGDNAYDVEIVDYH